MKLRVRSMWPICLLLALALPLRAQAGEESLAAVFLDEPAGARPVAMGSAFTAMAEDANAVYWNPAGLALVQRKELLLSHTQSYQGFRQEYLAFCLPLTLEDALGINAFAGYGEPLEKFTSAGESIGSFMAYDLYLTAAYSRMLDRTFAAGLAVKGIFQQIDSYNAWSAAADLGLMARELLPDLQLALVLRNAGKPMTMVAESHWLNLAVDFGAAYTRWNRRLLFTFDLHKPLAQELQFKCGAEVAAIEDVLWLRAGYRYYQYGNDLGPLSGLALGLGLRIADYSVDYAYSPFPGLGDMHKIAISLPFGRSLMEEQLILQKLEKQVKAKQKVIYDNLVAEGDQLFAAGEYEKAGQIYTKAFAINPEDQALRKKIVLADNSVKKRQALNYVQRGQKAFAAQDYLTALVEWSKALELTPQDAAARQLLATANKKLSEEKLSAADNQNKQAIESLFQQGLGYLQKSRYGDALDMWKKILALDPNNQRVAQYLRVTKTKMEDLIQDLLDLADQDWAESRFVEAVKKWQYILDMNADQAQAREKLRLHKPELVQLADEYYRLGVEQYVKNNLPAAIKHWKDVLVIDPAHAKAAQYLPQAQKKQQLLESIQ